MDLFIISEENLENRWGSDKQEIKRWSEKWTCSELIFEIVVNEEEIIKLIMLPRFWVGKLQCWERLKEDIIWRNLET